MMKFETINNQLCRMVEPEPLTKNAQFPCVVQLIQDDSPMGGYNRTMETAYTLRRTLTALRVFSDSNVEAKDILLPAGNYNRYEIIGYPVVDGSAEWALYQMMQGKWVVHEKAYPCHIHANMITWSNTETPPMFTMQTPETWLSENFLHSGWQLYEKPAPAFKVGDWVEFKGKQYRISAIGGKGLFDDDNLIMFEGVIWCVSEKAELRKLDPSEVIVSIGCLSGTAIRHTDTSFFLLHKDKKVQAVIPFTMLDPATRSLVESLLKAQEEK